MIFQNNPVFGEFMEFISLKEYFYKLQNALYLSVLVPLGIFTLLYLTAGQRLIEHEQSLMIISFVLLLMLSDWLAGLVFFRLKLKKIIGQPSLRARLKQYYSITIVRSYINILACLMPAVGFYLTAETALVYVLGVVLLLFFIFWPRSLKVCRDLKLKGDERAMVRYKKDML